MISTAARQGSRTSAVVVALVVLGLLLAARPAHAATITVNTSADDSAANGNCTLREAITAANTNAAVDGCASGGLAFVKDTIDFAIPGNGPHTIAPASELPRIGQPVTIDGYTESLDEAVPATPNTATDGTTNAELRVVLSGANAPVNSNGLTMGGGETTVRGLVINGFRSTEGNFVGGIGIFLDDTAGNAGSVIEGNFIGTDADGNSDLGNGVAGIRSFGGRGTGDNTVGGTALATRNLVSGNDLYGVWLDSNDNETRGNLVGTDTAGALDLGNGENGIFSELGSRNLIANNLVAFNDRDGVSVGSSGAGNRIVSNSIFSNGALGIELGGNGPTANDPDDADTGANGLQNFPVITSAKTSRSATTIKGTLNSTPNRAFPSSSSPTPPAPTRARRLSGRGA